MTPAASKIISGDDQDFTFDLYGADGALLDVSSASLIQVAFATADRQTRVIGPVTATSNYSGASWSTGRIVVPITSVQSSEVAGQPYLVFDCRVTISGKTTTYVGSGPIAVMQSLFD